MGAGFLSLAFCAGVADLYEKAEAIEDPKGREHGIAVLEKMITRAWLHCADLDCFPQVARLIAAGNAGDEFDIADYTAGLPQHLIPRRFRQ